MLTFRQRLWLDYAGGVGAALAMLSLQATQRVTPSTAAAYWIGAGIALVKEVTHLLIPKWIRLVDEEVERDYCRPLYAVAHASWDGVLFLVFDWFLCDTGVFRIPATVTVGLVVEVLVELAGNGNVWHYSETKRCNPVLYRRVRSSNEPTLLPDPAFLAARHNGTVGYTLWPFLEWIFEPLVWGALTSSTLVRSR